MSIKRSYPVREHNFDEFMKRDAFFVYQISSRLISIYSDENY